MKIPRFRCQMTRISIQQIILLPKSMLSINIPKKPYCEDSSKFSKLHVTVISLVTTNKNVCKYVSKTVRDYSIHDLFYCMSFTVLGLCSPGKNDARLVILQLLVFKLNFSYVAVNKLNFSLYFSSDFPAFTSSSTHVLFTCSTILCLV